MNPFRRKRNESWPERAAGIQAERAARKSALAGKEALATEVSAILFEEDPISLDFGDNTDEYDAEAESIVLRLAEASGAGDVQRIAHEEFVRWFDADIAGPPARYGEIARRIWSAATR